MGYKQGNKQMPFKKGNTYGKALAGRKLTEEHKAKLRQAKLGTKQSEETKEKRRQAMLGRDITWGDKISEALKGVPRPQQSGDKNSAWKGDNVGYHAMHSWVRREKGAASECVFCGTKSAKRYEWANVDHLYSRNLDDYISLCAKCHKRFDKQ